MRALAVLVCTAWLGLAQAPTVDKVEPPDWWTGSTMNPVRLLIHGDNLTGAKATAKAPLVASRVKVSVTGTYLFADILIPKTAAPGVYPITITTPAGKTQARFEVVAPLPPAGRFAGFSSEDVIYLIMPDRFVNGDPSNDDPPSAKGLFNPAKPRYYHGGDFAGIRAKLPYLKDLGVTALWINPWYDNADRLNSFERYNNEDITDYHGYGAIDFYGVEQHFGTAGELRALIDEAHSLGLKVIQDQVANHTGPYHPWVADSPTPTWYNGTQASHPNNDWQTWTLMDPHATPAMRRSTLDGWFINILPDLNQSDPETRRYLIQNSLWWVGRFGLDGIRQDTLPYAPRDFWRDWTAALAREWPRLRVVGEVFDGDPAMTSFFQGGRKMFDGIDTGVQFVFDFPLYYAIRSAFAEGKTIRDVPKLLSHDSLYSDPSRLVTFLGLHDVERFMNVNGATIDGLALAFTVLFTVRGAPLVYYGDEIAMPGGNDPDNRRDFQDTGWSAAQKGLQGYVARLAAMRKEHPAFRTGTMENLFAGEQIWAFARKTSDETVVVVLNNGAAPAAVEFAAPFPDGTPLKSILDSTEITNVQDGKMKLEMPARSVMMLAR